MRKCGVYCNIRPYETKEVFKAWNDDQKNLTRNQKVTDVLNKLGHFISYHFIEKIETEMKFEVT